MALRCSSGVDIPLCKLLRGWRLRIVRFKLDSLVSGSAVGERVWRLTADKLCKSIPSLITTLILLVLVRRWIDYAFVCLDA